MTDQSNARNYLRSNSWINLTKVATLAGIKPKTLSNYVNEVPCNPRYPDSKPRNLTSGDFDKLVEWLAEFTNFTN